MGIAPFRAAFLSAAIISVMCCPLLLPPAAAQKAFPYGAELRLEARPMKGSKRVPWLQFSESGMVDIDLWCATGRGRAIVVDRTLTIVPTTMRDNQCSPEQLEADKDVLTRLMQVTGWRWEGFLLVLDGPQPLRWRPASN